MSEDWMESRAQRLDALGVPFDELIATLRLAERRAPKVVWYDDDGHGHDSDAVSVRRLTHEWDLIIRDMEVRHPR